MCHSGSKKGWVTMAQKLYSSMWSVYWEKTLFQKLRACTSVMSTNDFKKCVQFSFGKCYGQNCELVIFVYHYIFVSWNGQWLTFQISPNPEILYGPKANQGQEKSNLETSQRGNIWNNLLDFGLHTCLAASLLPQMKGVQIFPWILFCCSLTQKKEQSWTIPWLALSTLLHACF